MTKFIILTLPRCGSSLLIKALNKHPDVYCADELFYLSLRKHSNKNRFPFFKIKLFSKKVNYLINYPFTRLRINNFLTKFLKNLRGEKFTARGFKLLHNQITYLPGLLEYIKANNVKVIFLTRKNVVRYALSLTSVQSRTRDDYHIEPAETLKLPKLKIKTNKLQRRLEKMIHQNNRLNNFMQGLNCIKINYEDFVDFDKMMNTILNFLEVTPKIISIENKNAKPEDLKNLIDNYDEVVEWLKQNNYSEFIN